MQFKRNHFVLLLLLLGLVATALGSSRVRREDVLPADDGQAESKANKLLENAGQLTSQLGGAINKYFTEGRQQLSVLYEKAGTSVVEASKKLKETSSDQYKKAAAQMQGVISSVRTSLGSLSGKAQEGATATAETVANAPTASTE